MRKGAAAALEVVMERAFKETHDNSELPSFGGVQPIDTSTHHSMALGTYKRGSAQPSSM